MMNIYINTCNTVMMMQHIINLPRITQKANGILLTSIVLVNDIIVLKNSQILKHLQTVLLLQNLKYQIKYQIIYAQKC